MAASFGRTRLLMARLLLGRFPCRNDYMPAACGVVVLAAAAAWRGAQTAGGSGLSDLARALHSGALVFDGHIHAVDREFYHGGDIGQRKPDGQVDLPPAKEGGHSARFF